MEQCASEVTTPEFEDWPLDGSRDAAWALRATRRQSLTFLTHHNSWVQKSGIREGDRAVHEHGSICRALHYFASYDQVNFGALAGIEALIKRMELIEEAYRGRPAAPNYEGAEHWLGQRETLDGTLINPELWKHAASRLKEEADIQKERRKWVEEKQALQTGGGQNSKTPKPGKGKGKGKEQEAPPGEG